MRLIFLTTLCLVIYFGGHAQAGYLLRFKITGLKDTTAMLGYYYGESTYVKDTATGNSKGEFTFDGKEPLPHGVYFVVLNKTRIFELLVSSTQKFTMETDTSDYIKHMKVTGDQDNKLFFENMLFNMERHKEAEPYIKVIQDSTLAEEKKKEAREAFGKINEKVMDYHDAVIAQYPNTLTAKIFKSSQPVKVPAPPKREDGSIDSTFQLRWYREHYFDNFDLSDDALIRMPRSVYAEKVNEYLDKLFVPEADTLIKAIEWMVAKAKKNQETYKYLLWNCVLKYQNPDIMGLDKVFIHLNDKYFASGEMNFWANDKLKKNLQDHASQLRKSLIGNVGANLIMQDANQKLRSMYDLHNRYTIIFFFDPECPTCKKETPVLAGFYEKNKIKFNAEVFAVCSDSSLTKMRNYIKEMKLNWITVNGPRSAVGNYQDLYDADSTPTLYILDEEKKIIAKNIPAGKVEEFLTNYERFQRKKTAAPTGP